MSNAMSEWIKVVTHPLGLSGFALFLVFVYLGRAHRSERRWLSPVAFVIAAIALVGGLVLAHVQVAKPAASSLQTNPPPAPTNQQVQQKTTGQGSPAVQGVQGDVTITVDQSKEKTEIQKPPEKKPKQESQ
jgi:hypothetical protein